MYGVLLCQVRIEEDLARVDWSRPPITGPRILYISSKASNLVSFSSPHDSVLAEWAQTHTPQVSSLRHPPPHPSRPALSETD